MDDKENVSDHLPVMVTLECPMLLNSQGVESVPKILKWNKMSADDIEKSYTQHQRNELDTIDIDAISKSSQQEVDIYY